MLIAVLFILGLIFGSFAGALAHRIHGGQNWLAGRSQCESCAHTLAAVDLVPLLSWVILRGRCRYCRASISWRHPLTELSGGLVFAMSYIFWPLSLNLPGQRILFISWLIASVGLLALALFDSQWMILPNKILHPTLIVAVIGRLAYIAYQPDKAHLLIIWLAGVAVASGLFWLLFVVSRGRWIGFGDVRLGLVSGTILADPTKSALMIFVASLLGTFFAFVLAAVGQRRLSTKIAYGPFLIIGTFLVVLFGQSVIDWYNRLFLG